MSSAPSILSRPASTSPRISRSPWTIRAASSGAMMPERPSIVACAMLPRMSARYSRWSNGSDVVNAAICGSGLPRKRPPHSRAVTESSLRGCRASGMLRPRTGAASGTRHRRPRDVLAYLCSTLRFDWLCAAGTLRLTFARLLAYLCTTPRFDRLSIGLASRARREIPDELRIDLGEHFGREAEQADEAGGVALIVARAPAEGRQIMAVQRPRRPAADDRGRALEEFDPDGPRHRFLRGRHERVEGPPQRRVPEPVVHELRVLGGHQRLVVLAVSIEGDRLEVVVGLRQHGPARRLIDAPALHADEPVLDDIHPPHPVRAREAIEGGDQRDRIQGAPVHAHRRPALEP